MTNANQFAEIIIELFGPEISQAHTRSLLQEKSIAHRTKILLDQQGNAHSIIQLTSTDYLTFQLMQK